MNDIDVLENQIMVIDDFIPKRLQDDIESLLHDGYFPYYFDAKTNFYNKNGFDVSQFIHNFYKDGNTSQWWECVKPLFHFLEQKIKIYPYEIERAKANLQLPYPVKQHHPLHFDSDAENAYSLLYYVNDSDGDTVFSVNNSLEHISPKKGRAIFFKSSILHAGSSPNTSDTRVVLNFVAHFDLRTLPN